METFFIKYLPSQSRKRKKNIALNDTYYEYDIHTGGYGIGEIIEHVLVIGEDENGIKYKEPIPFLCTKNHIVPGDIIWGTRTGGWNTLHCGKFLYDDKEYVGYKFIEFDGEPMRCHDWFKIISKVSPKAIWLQNDQELKKEEFRINFIKDIAYILNPSCKHYH